MLLFGTVADRTPHTYAAGSSRCAEVAGAMFGTVLPRMRVPRPARAASRRRWRRMTASLWEGQQRCHSGAITLLAAYFLSAVMPSATAFFARPTSRPPRSWDAGMV
jgi:hypothetical protein